jgi:hypothetical protein
MRGREEKRKAKEGKKRKRERRNNDEGFYGDKGRTDREANTEKDR